MKTYKCPYCGIEANFISAKRSKLPSWPAGIPSYQPDATEHLIGGKVCLQERLTRSEAKRAVQSNALADFRHAILHAEHFTDIGRDVILRHLDDAFSPIRGTPPTGETDGRPLCT